MTMFSVHYIPPDEDETTDFAADWGRVKGKWTTSNAEYGSGRRWNFEDTFGEPAYQGVLMAFGLKETEISLEKLVVTSPAQLAEIGKNDPLSYTIGDKRKASEVK